MAKVKFLIGFAILLTIASYIEAVSTPCDLRDTANGGVCVCTASYCDYLEDPTPEDEAAFSLVSSSKAGLRFETTKGLFNLFKKYYIFDYDQRLRTQAENKIVKTGERYSPPRTAHLEINRDAQYRNIVGFGGAFTGAVSYLVEKLPVELQDHLYRSFYSSEGIGWNLLRMSIGGSDFDLEPWAYNEQPENDAGLTNFTKLDPRDEKKVEQIQRLKTVTKLNDLKIKGAAWSPPKWMKSNNAWTGFGQLKREYYQTWADYHLKWLELMEKNGLPIWAISTGNEPMNGLFFMYFVKFMSLGWSPLNQAQWLSQHLGPTIRNSKYKDLVIFGNDDQRYTFPSWFQMMKIKHSKSLDYIDGLGVHWYWDEIFKPSLIDKTLEQMPDKILLVTESCIGDKPWHKSAPVLGSWERGEKYARAFLQNLQHGYNGWIDWNLLLDENGGPNYVDNTVDAPIIVDTNNPTEILKQPMFYTMGHFSKFIPEGSIRIDAIRSNVNIDSVAYLRPDGTISAVIFNSGAANVEVNVVDNCLTTPCDLQQTKYGFVCKCTTNYCDYLEEPALENENSWIAITSSKNGLRFHLTEGVFGLSDSKKIYDYREKQKGFDIDAVVLDSGRSLFQWYTNNIRLGFGGAITGTVAHILQNLQAPLQDHLYKSYFHKDGIAYNMLRTSIGGCDFDLEPWAYNEQPQNDRQLSNFTQLDVRDLLKLKIIERLKSVAVQNDIKIMAAAWSPPPWMKSNNNWTGYSSLKAEYYETWALYHLKFLELMLAKNITIWAISTGNEPLNGVIGWLFIHFMSLGWSPQNQAIYLNDYLGPALKKSKFKNVLIFGNDDQRYSYPKWFQAMNLTRPTSLNYLDGLAVHWYWDEIFGPELIDYTLKFLPNKLLFNTEACIGDKPWQTHGPELGSWERGEQYIRSLLQDFKHSFNGWLDWNLILDENGGPNYVNNTVDAPIIANTKNNAEFYKQPIFYAMGHFSKFIAENSKRIELKISAVQNTLDAVGFKRPDNKIVLIIFNSAAISQDIELNDSEQGTFNINIPARSIHTIIYT
ncbi:hypothetical protein DOY81_001346 [Sarcophaga bullata]|nr:hypothetical protein DOY81_001346 [Sarcophaga bullata]